MSPPPIPTKTARGQEAMRRRTGELGQRHRTILFLVDGRRPLAEVLSLAHQAGAATSHFEDLVRMGFVALPAEQPPAPPPVEAPLEAPMPAQITELAVEVVSEAEPAAGAEPSVAAMPAAEPAPEPVPERAPEPLGAAVAPAPTLIRAPALPPLPDEPVQVRPAPVARLPAPPDAALLQEDPVLEWPRRPFLPPSRAVPTPPPPAPPVLQPAQQQPVLEQARAQLLEALRCDPQPTSSRLVDRVRAAQGSSELIDVVWTMERGLHHPARTHRGLIALQRARELLGLGNTLVDEDSTPGRLDDDDW